MASWRTLGRSLAWGLACGHGWSAGGGWCIDYRPVHVVTTSTETIPHHPRAPTPGTISLGPATHRGHACPPPLDSLIIPACADSAEVPDWSDLSIFCHFRAVRAIGPSGAYARKTKVSPKLSRFTHQSRSSRRCNVRKPVTQREGQKGGILILLLVYLESQYLRSRSPAIVVHTSSSRIVSKAIIVKVNFCAALLQKRHDIVE
jgi:hypothetical protein